MFFSAAALAGSFGGLLAAAIAKMDGIGGKSGWAWIFIIEGIATVFVRTFSNLHGIYTLSEMHSDKRTGWPLLLVDGL